MQSELKERTQTVGIDISIDGINQTNWIRFMALSKQARQRFLSDWLNEGLENILYKNPEMLAEYISRGLDDS